MKTEGIKGGAWKRCSWGVGNGRDYSLNERGKLETVSNCFQLFTENFGIVEFLNSDPFPRYVCFL